jgi:hypothetical protein
MHLFGNLGHIALMGPLALATIFYLISIDARRDAYAFAAALIACLAATLVSKLFFEACGPRVPALQIETPSGHESFSAAVLGCLAVLIATGRPARRQALIYGGAAVLLLLIGVGRISAHVHTPEEVAFGFLIGGLATTLFRSLRGEQKAIMVPWRAIARASPAALVLAFAALVFMRHWTPEYFIDSVGRGLNAHYGLCV